MPGEEILETVTFEAVYEDGQRVQFNVSKYVRNGDVDETAKTMAYKNQQDGKFPPGRITSVERTTS